MENTNVWCDAFGYWHASVPIMGSPVREAREARRLIAREIQARQASKPVFKVTRENVTNHGTVVYGERKYN